MGTVVSVARISLPVCCAPGGRRAIVMLIDLLPGLSRMSHVMYGDRTNGWSREEGRLCASAP